MSELHALSFSGLFRITIMTPFDVERLIVLFIDRQESRCVLV
jgi:hypothetical protein